MSDQPISIQYQSAGKFEETRYEKIHNVIVKSTQQGALLVAKEIARLIRTKQQNKERCVLGLATGSSPIKVYEELVRMHKEEGLSFLNVVTFNLDEYYPMQQSNIQSYYYFMHQHLFDHIDILPENIHIPDAKISKEDLHQYCVDYEMNIKKLGGIDFQLLGIGRTGHIGFNEPGSHVNSGTRNITLDYITRIDAAPTFLGIKNVPRRAITMGIGTVLSAKRIVLLAWGINKAEIILKTIEGKITAEVPATYLQGHSNTSFLLDEGASSALTRVRTPWLVSSCTWHDSLKLKAVVWLSKLLAKPILRLIDKDYNNKGMSGLLTDEGDAYDLNIKMFNRLQHTITGWPGGKPNADDTNRPERAIPAKKRVLIFSPHPGNDIISMGGTIERLVEQNHDVHVVYQTSGNIAVTNEEALKFAEIALSLNPKSENITTIITSLLNKTDNDVDSLNIRELKGKIRQSEARAALRFLGVEENNIHFLQLPFYETGTIKKSKLSELDVNKMTTIIEEIKPHQIYASGDLADPHNTHEVCLSVLEIALKKLKTQDYMQDIWVWLYRGVWHEWETFEIEMAVPMSPDQVLKKRHAIFYHQSQNQGAMYQGDDAREFWVRIEDRNRETAKIYNNLGLADYEAMEAFKKLYF